MIHAFHAIFGAYGFWLPNDPRGSWSDFDAAWELFRYGGKPNRVYTRHSRAHDKHDHQHRRDAKELLKHDEVRFTGRQALAVAQGFKQAADESGYRLLACAILPTHVHLVLVWHQRKIRRIIGHLKTRATQHLHQDRLWTNSNQPIWATGGWNVYIDDWRDVPRAIRYAEQNPIKEGLPKQTWSFVVPLERIAPATVERCTTI
jgi:REP element-mobilizing transposase RayT